MFNGPCQLHGYASAASLAAADLAAADEVAATSGGLYISQPAYGHSGQSASTALPHGHQQPQPQQPEPPCTADHCLMNPGLTCPDVYMALQGVQFMAEHTRREQYTIRVMISMEERVIIHHVSLRFNAIT